MRSVVARLALAAVTISLLLLFYWHRGQNMVVAENHTPVTITRLYAGDNGLSHVERVEVKFSPVAGAPTVGQSDPVKTTSSYVGRLAPGFFESWHNADRRRYVVTISGRAEIEVAGGQKFLAEPRKIGLAEDLSGKGHTFRVVG